MFQFSRWIRIVLASPPVAVLPTAGKAYLDARLPVASVGTGLGHALSGYQLALTAFLSLVFVAAVAAAKEADRKSGRHTVLPLAAFAALAGAINVFAGRGLGADSLFRAVLLCVAVGIGVLTLNRFDEIAARSRPKHR